MSDKFGSFVFFDSTVLRLMLVQRDVYEARKWLSLVDVPRRMNENIVHEVIGSFGADRIRSLTFEDLEALTSVYGLSVNLMLTHYTSAPDLFGRWYWVAAATATWGSGHGVDIPPSLPSDKPQVWISDHVMSLLGIRPDLAFVIIDELRWWSRDPIGVDRVNTFLQRSVAGDTLKLTGDAIRLAQIVGYDKIAHRSSLFDWLEGSKKLELLVDSEQNNRYFLHLLDEDDNPIPTELYSVGWHNDTFPTLSFCQFFPKAILCDPKKIVLSTEPTRKSRRLACLPPDCGPYKRPWTFTTSSSRD